MIYIYYEVKDCIKLTHYHNISLQDIRQNHCRSCSPTIILRSKVGLNWLIIQMNDFHPSIREIHWTVKLRSLWPAFILRSKVVTHWFIIQKSDVHPSRYKAKSLDHEIRITVTYIYIQAKLEKLHHTGSLSKSLTVIHQIYSSRSKVKSPDHEM